MLGLISGIRITMRATEALLAPWLSLLIRLWLAQVFIIAGVHQMMGHAGEQAMIGWQPALLHETTSSDPGMAVQAICPVLLAMGLFARLTPAALLLQALFLPVAGVGPEARLFWAALLMSLIVYGAGPFSVDRLLRRGAHSSAVPGAALIVAASGGSVQRVGITPPSPIACMDWGAARKGCRTPNRARRCRPRSEPGAEDRPLFATIASVATCSCAD